ncbi:MAG: GDSL-type esterase/lipase family protein [Clostridia bacterium]|nr:GDSL-type esterase/lipase family protein [Clostridia bacterium]
MTFSVKSLPIKISSPLTPKMFNIDVPSNSAYRVRVVLRAQAETSVTLLSQFRRFVLDDKHLLAGEALDFSFLAHVCDYRWRDKETTFVNCVSVGIMCGAAVVETIEAEKIDGGVLYIGGDSTVSDQTADYPYRPYKTYCGWAQMLPLYMPQLCISNHAQSGASTQSWREWNFPPVWRTMQSGDFLLLQFGHNDQKCDFLAPMGGYRDNLLFFIQEAREKGVTPILCTPINRIIFEEDGTLDHSLDEYAAAVISAAKEEGVCCIDLHGATTRHFESLGEDNAWKYFRFCGSERDFTHPNDYGGKLVAKMAATLLEHSAIEGLVKR